MALVVYFPSKVLYAENFTFLLYTKGVQFGSFSMKAIKSGNSYQLSSSFKSSGVLGKLTRISIVSGAHGIILNHDAFELRPIEVLSKWESVFSKKKSIIKYKNNKISLYEVLPYPRKNSFAIDPYIQEGTLDPLSVTYWLVGSRKQKNLCEGTRTVTDGQTLIKVTFNGKTTDKKKVICSGTFKFLEGFDPLKYTKTDYKFKLTFEKLKNSKPYWQVTSLEFLTRIGMIKAVRILN